MPRLALLVLLLVAGCGGSEPRLSAPAVPPDQPPDIRVDGLRAGQTVELHAAWRSDDRSLWTSRTELRADDEGRAVAGPEVLTAMEPPEDGEPYFEPPFRRSRVALRVHDGGDVVARATLERDLVPPSVGFRELTFEADGIAGLVFAPERPRGAAVVVLGGSEGGHYGLASEAARLAAAGHPVLALGYFGEPGLPKRLVDVPVETVAHGVTWLGEQPMAEGRPMALIGVSRGGELALLAASLDPTLMDRVVALVPSSRIGFGDVSGQRPAWTWAGEPLEPRTPIEVERIRGRVLAVGAGQDAAWYSKAYVNEIDKRGGARIVPLQYEDAGHAVGGPLPYLPSRPTNLTGGTAEADEEARRDLWPRILDFLD